MDSRQQNQWERLRKNLGVWQGAFEQFSPQGKPVSATPSLLTLEENEPGQTISLTLERFPEDAPKKVDTLSFTYPGPGASISFFDDGSFAQGSAQWSAFGQFGTEFSLKIGDDRRVRYVVMYESTQQYSSKIKYVTLICETQEGKTAFVDSDLSTAQLIGDWTGKAQVMFFDGKPPATGSSQCHIDDSSGEALAVSAQERWASGTHKLQAEGKPQERLILLQAATEEQPDYRLMLLPKGGYCLLPTEIKKGQAFRIEVGWLGQREVQTDVPGGAFGEERSRLIRYYDTRGVCTELVLAKDRK